MSTVFAVSPVTGLGIGRRRPNGVTLPAAVGIVIGDTGEVSEQPAEGIISLVEHNLRSSVPPTGPSIGRGIHPDGGV
jgi:hypothetical protein